MNLTINGQAKQFIAPHTVASLLVTLELNPARVVVELNSSILTLDKHAEMQLNDGDTLELIQFVGGG